LQPILSVLVFGPGLAACLRALSPILEVGGVDEVHFSLQGSYLGFVHALYSSGTAPGRPKLSGTPLGEPVGWGMFDFPKVAWTIKLRTQQP
jgi:hypothetical protein